MIPPPKLSHGDSLFSAKGRRRLARLMAIVPLALAAAVWTRNLIYIEPGKWFNLGLDLVGGVSAVYQADWSTASDVARTWGHQRILEVSREILVDRLAAKGIDDAEIRVATSASALHIDIPNVSDPSAVFDIVGRTGKLEFRPVLEKADESKAFNPDAPDVFRYYTALVRLGQPVFTGDQLDASRLRLISPQPGSTGEDAYYRIAFGFQPAIAEQWDAYALRHKGQQLAIVLDRDVRTMPTIREDTTDARSDVWTLTGRYGLEEARDHYLLLKHGQLPVELRQSQITLIGASPGHSFQRDGLQGFAWATVGLILMLVVFYANRRGSWLRPRWPSWHWRSDSAPASRSGRFESRWSRSRDSCSRWAWGSIRPSLSSSRCGNRSGGSRDTAFPMRSSCSLSTRRTRGVRASDPPARDAHEFHFDRRPAVLDPAAPVRLRDDPRHGAGLHQHLPDA